jgi:hypothetical protein
MTLCTLNEPLFTICEDWHIKVAYKPSDGIVYVITGLEGKRLEEILMCLN